MEGRASVGVRLSAKVREEARDRVASTRAHAPHLRDGRGEDEPPVLQPLGFHLIDIARENGIAGFTAEVLAENRATQHVFHKSGLEVESQLDSGVYSLTMDLSPAEEKGEPRRRMKGKRKRSA
jgi:hypothetical protein